MSYIRELINKGRIIASSEADEEITKEELSPTEQELVNEGAEVEETSVQEEGTELSVEETSEGVVENQIEEEVEEEKEPVEVKKTYTMEILAKVMAVFDQYFNELKIDWNSYVIK